MAVLIEINNSNGKHDYKVTAVVDESLGKSHLHANMFITMNSGGLGEYVRQNNSWAGNNFTDSYVKLNPKANAAALLQVDTGEKLSAADKFRIASLGQIDEALRKKNITLDVAVALESRMHDIEGNISAGEAAIQQAKDLADALKEQEKATQALVNVGQKELDSLDAKIQKQREVNQQIGLTKAQTEALNSARQIQSALADEEYAQLLRNAAAYAGEYTSAYVQYANALDLAARKKRDLAGLEAQASVKLSMRRLAMAAIRP